MKINLLRILLFCSILTTLGYIMDGDPKEPGMAMRFVEFFAMLATTFILISIVYYITAFTFKKVRRVSF